MTQQADRPSTPATETSVPAQRWQVRQARRAARSTPALLVGLLLGVLGVLAVQAWVLDDPKPADLGVFTPAPADDAPDVTVIMSNDLIAALIQQSIDRGETVVPLTNVRVATDDNRLHVRGDLKVLSRQVSGAIVLEPEVENGALRLRVRSARFGRLPVPSSIEHLAEDPINRQFTASLHDLPATITSARATATGLTVTADVRVDDLLAPR